MDHRAHDHVEEKEFTLRLEVRCAFPPDYQGDGDGFEWFAEFEPLAAEIVRAARQVIAGRPGWTVRPGNRGRPADEEITLLVERAPP
jgi:hypothetical protein